MSDTDNRQGGEEAASSDIAVTPEMIEAGIDSLAGIFPDAASDTMHAKAAVCAIWAAMLEQWLAAGLGECAPFRRDGLHREL